MSEEIEGRCHCGAVTVRVPQGAFGVVACHCGDCQKLHGNYFAMLAVARGDARWTGEDAIRWYQTSAGARRSFCGTCGSRLAKEPTGSDRVLISVGLFDPALPRRIAKQVWTQSKPHWYDLPAEG